MFIEDLRHLRQQIDKGLTTTEIMQTLIHEIGLEAAVSTLDTNRHGMNRAAQSDDLLALSQLARLHDNPRTFQSWLTTSFEAAARDDHAGVMLSTIHRVKGQEWPMVIVHMADEQQFPHRLAEDHEEERRLFHVAITRAQRELHIVSSSSPSPFIAELSTEPPEVVSSRSAPRRAERRSRTQQKAPARQREVRAAPSQDLTAEEQQRFDALVDLRNQLRGEKPAYVVFDNKTAVQLARLQPTTLADLQRVPGIGPGRAENYGAHILAILTEH